MSKFKVGDRVRFRTWDDMEKEFGLDNDGDIACRASFVANMRHLCGTEARIKKLDGKDVELEDFTSTESTIWNFSTDMLEPTTETRQKTFPTIVISTDGKTTTAVKRMGKTEIKRATARCSPEDSFDFDTGAKIAMERLLHTELSPAGSKFKFTLGDVIIGNEKASSKYIITKEGWIGMVVETFKNGDVGARASDSSAVFRLEPEYFEHYDFKTKQRFYSGKVVCTGSADPSFTVGKVYEFADGKVRDNDGTQRPTFARITSLDDEYMKNWYSFIPLLM